MYLKFRLTALILFLLVHSSTVYAQYQISESETARILGVLSSDEMRGRQALTPDADRAATLISDEFEEAGLVTMAGLDSYLQEFELYEYVIVSSEVKLDGEVIPDNSYFGYVYESELNWTPDNIQIAGISAGDNFLEKLNVITSGDESALIFVDKAHADLFGRYQAFFSRRNSRSMEGDNSSSFVMVLSEPADDFVISIESEVTVNRLSNVVGKIEGNRDDEIVLFSAHYDHLGVRQPVEGDSIANGANDNASGVTAIIELAKYFESLGTPERTLLFVGFTAEELGGYGSQYFSRQLEPDKIVAMFNIEMIGKPAVAGPNTAWITGYERSTFGELLSKSAEGTIYEFYPDPYPQQNLFYRSDNATLARLGVPAHSISTTPIDVDQDYHQVTDEFETIDIAHLTNTIKAIAKAAEGIISAEDTPTRVDASLVD